MKIKLIQSIKEHYRLIIIPLAFLVIWGAIFIFLIPMIETTTPELTSFEITLAFIVLMAIVLYSIDKTKILD